MRRVQLIVHLPLLELLHDAGIYIESAAMCLILICMNKVVVEACRVFIYTYFGHLVFVFCEAIGPGVDRLANHLPLKPHIVPVFLFSLVVVDGPEGDEAHERHLTFISLIELIEFVELSAEVGCVLRDVGGARHQTQPSPRYIEPNVSGADNPKS